MGNKFKSMADELKAKCDAKYQKLEEEAGENKAENYIKEVEADIEVINENLSLLKEMFSKTRNKEKTYELMNINITGYIICSINTAFGALIDLQEEIVQNGNKSNNTSYRRLRDELIETTVSLKEIDEDIYEKTFTMMGSKQRLVQAMLRDYELDKKLERFGVDFKTTIEYYPKMYEEYKKKKDEKNGGEFEL